MAEFVRLLISERTRAGMAAARARGARIGRPAKLDAPQVDAVVAQGERRPLNSLHSALIFPCLRSEERFHAVESYQLVESR